MAKLPEIGLGTACLLSVTLPEFIDLAARHGFKRISARPYAFAQALQEGHTEASLRQLLSDAGLTVTMIDGLNHGLPGVPPPESLDAATRAMMPPDVLGPPDAASCLHAASALGASILNVIAYRGSIVPLEQMAEAVSGICRTAADAGIQIALEFVPESGIPDLSHARRLWEACNEPNCGIVLDTFHLGRSGGTVGEVRNLPKGAISAIQISDRAPGERGHVPFSGRLMPGEGSLPLRDLIDAALANNADATIDIEVLNADLGALPADTATRKLADAAMAWREIFESV